jgi:tetratricopeptide (TPR) repeat protein
MDENGLRERKKFLAEMEEYLGRDELPTALRLAWERLEKRPGDLEARIVICRAWLQQGSLDEAREMLDETEQIITSLSHVYASVGEVCLKRGMREAAEGYFEKFRALSPRSTPARGTPERLDEGEEFQKSDGEGEEEEDGAAEVPHDFQTVTLAELYIRQGHFQLAEELLEKILGEDPQNGKAAALLTEVREKHRGTGSAPPETGVVAELSHWLENIGRMRDRAA